jgi:hypothetical protein
MNKVLWDLKGVYGIRKGYLMIAKNSRPLIFYDWEFQEDGITVEPISLGMVSSNGHELYLINKSFDWDKATDWLKQNVKPNLYLAKPQSGSILEVTKQELRNHILNFLTVEFEVANEKPKLVGWFSPYDFVCTAQRFGALVDKPNLLPWWNCDLKQWADDLGNPRLPEKPAQHNALLDARWTKDSYKWLSENYNHPAWTAQASRYS